MSLNAARTTLELTASPYHARIALCKLLHLFLQGLCRLQLIQQLHLQEGGCLVRCPSSLCC